MNEKLQKIDLNNKKTKIFTNFHLQRAKLWPKNGLFYEIFFVDLAINWFYRRNWWINSFITINNLIIISIMYWFLLSMRSIDCWLGHLLRLSTDLIDESTVLLPSIIRIANELNVNECWCNEFLQNFLPNYWTFWPELSKSHNFDLKKTNFETELKLKLDILTWITKSHNFDLRTPKLCRILTLKKPKFDKK